CRSFSRHSSSIGRWAGSRRVVSPNRAFMAVPVNGFTPTIQTRLARNEERRRPGPGSRSGPGFISRRGRTRAEWREGQPKTDEPSHGQPGKVAWGGVKRLDQSGGIAGQGFHIEDLPSVVIRVPGLALSAMVIRDYPIASLKGRALAFKHGVVHKQAVRKDDGFPTATRLLVEQLNSVDLDLGHPGCSPCESVNHWKA